MWNSHNCLIVVNRSKTDTTHHVIWALKWCRWWSAKIDLMLNTHTPIIIQQFITNCLIICLYDYDFFFSQCETRMRFFSHLFILVSFLSIFVVRSVKFVFAIACFVICTSDSNLIVIFVNKCNSFVMCSRGTRETELNWYVGRQHFISIGLRATATATKKHTRILRYFFLEHHFIRTPIAIISNNWAKWKQQMIFCNLFSEQNEQLFRLAL